MGREPLRVVYDGACPMCSRWMAWALARDREHALEPVPLQSDEALTLGVDRDRLLEELHVWSPSEGIHTGADAVAAVLGRLPRWRWAGRLLRLPGMRSLARIGYRRIAGHRGRHPS